MRQSELEEYCRKWNLVEPQLIAQTTTSHIYKVLCANKTLVLKLLSDIGKRDEAKGAIALKYFDGEGAVRRIHSDAGAHLLEYIDGEPLSHLVKEGKDYLATEMICETLSKIHRPYNREHGELISLKERYQKLFLHAKEATDSIYIKGAEVAEEILNSPLDQVVLHGDIHHGNILYHSKRGWLAIDPKGLFGERAFDFLNSFFNPTDFPNLVLCEDRLLRMSKMASDRLDVDHKRILRFAFSYGCLSAVWSIEDGHDPGQTLKMTEILQKFI